MVWYGTVWYVWYMVYGVVLVEEAGGHVTAYDETDFEIKSGRILATNGCIHTILSRVLQQVKPLESFQPIVITES